MVDANWTVERIPWTTCERKGCYVSSYEEHKAGMAPTIDDVAAAAGVSRSTVSRALGGYGQVSSGAGQKIIAAAERLNYRVNKIARSTRTGRTDTLGLIVADVGNRFFSQVTRGFSDTARESGFQVIISNTDEDVEEERKAFQVFQEGRVDGIAVSPALTETPNHLFEAVAAHIPIVTLDRRVPGLEVDCVLLNSRAAAKEAVSHLIAAGHRRIAVVTGLTALPSPSSSHLARSSPGSERIAGYKDAMNEAGLAIEPGYILRQGPGSQQMAAGIHGLFHQQIPPTAIFATDENHALGAFIGIQTSDQTACRGVSLVAIDDPDWASVVSPRLSVVAQPSYELGALAAERLIARVQLRSDPVQEFILDYRWIGRESISIQPPPTKRRTAH